MKLLGAFVICTVGTANDHMREIGDQMSTQWNAENRVGWYYAYQKVRSRLMDMNLRHNKGQCCVRIEGVCTGTATQIHHILGIKVNKLDPNYMLPSCAACNQKIGDPTKHNPPRVRGTALD